ncbi:MAG: RagB/SusD family nutrient uptake outer membrane protein [Bacteroidota bacterium]
MKISIHKKYFFLLIVFLLPTLGCEDFLEEEFRDGITTDNFFNNDAEAILAVNGVYRILLRGSMYRTRGLDNYYQNGADETGPSRNVNGNIHNYLIAEGVSDGNGTWSSCYEIVRNTSLFLENVDGNENLSESVRNRSTGELLFLRSLAYYHLTNLWGDVPYFRTLLSPEELSTIGRTDRDLVRSEIKQDLARAIELLPEQYNGSDLARASKWAAATLKAKMHLADQEWAAAKEECLRIINESQHRLLDNFADVFDQSDPADQYNDEMIYSVDFTKDPIFGDGATQRTDDYNPRLRDEPSNRNNRPDGAGTPTRWQLLQTALRAQGEDMTGFGWAVPLPELADSSNWEEGDLRYDVTIVTEYIGFQLRFPYFRKNWNLNQENSPRQNHPENYVVFRLADVYLMAAEAENELNGPGGAYEYVNAVRARAFEPDRPWSGMTQQEFRESMYDERKFELCAEGHRKMDLIRWGILLDVVRNVQHRSFNNPAANIQPYHVLLPVPLNELLLNPNLLDSDPTNNGYR